MTPWPSSTAHSATPPSGTCAWPSSIRSSARTTCTEASPLVALEGISLCSFAACAPPQPQTGSSIAAMRNAMSRASAHSAEHWSADFHRRRADDLSCLSLFLPTGFHNCTVCVVIVLQSPALSVIRSWRRDAMRAWRMLPLRPLSSVAKAHCRCLDMTASVQVNNRPVRGQCAA